MFIPLKYSSVNNYFRALEQTPPLTGCFVSGVTFFINKGILDTGTVRDNEMRGGGGCQEIKMSLINHFNPVGNIS